MATISQELPSIPKGAAMLGSIFSDRDLAGLPERVRVAIRDQQDRSERIIGWFQLGVVLFIGTLYFLAPKTFTDDADFAPVPWALSTYFLLTVIRLVWAHRGRLPGWSLAISVVFDMGLLMTLIWSFHLQYAQPPSFYLKAPTLLWVFIFIALRALRFDWRYVAWAGFVAATLWSILVVYVIFIDPEDMMITRDFVQYMTSNSVLVGAEVEKIISILAVTTIIAVALRRARGLLVRSVTEQTAAQELSRFFAPEIADKIKTAQQEIHAGTGEMRDAAILNLDMRGFTRLAGDAPPEVVIGLLSDYQAKVVPVIQKHGGSIDKFLGDGIMATFGAAVPTETYAADSLRAIEEAIRVAEAWRAECEAAGKPCPRVNGAVATGQILFGAVGDETRLEFTVIGDAVNLSAKLEKENKARGVSAICDAKTYELALAQGYQPDGPREQVAGSDIGGVGHPVDLVVLAR
ncbi:MAG: adenylate/guanylate cyclase domain-containing protein [Pseudomonadota bacterium]